LFIIATEILVPGLHFYDISKAESFGRKSAVTHGAPAHPSTHLPDTKTADPFSITREINEKVWKNYKSEYAYHKKETPAVKKTSQQQQQQR
jgi:hypothetical protein